MDADIAAQRHDPLHLPMPEGSLEHILLDIRATNPPQHLNRCPQAVLPFSMCPMGRRVEEFDEGGMAWGRPRQSLVYTYVHH